MEFMRKEVENGGYLYEWPGLTFSEAINLLQDESEVSSSFRAKIESIFTEERAGMHGVFWECPPTTSNRFETQPFEFVVFFTDILRNEKVLLEEVAFSNHLKADKLSVIAFPSLGGDATMVSPAYNCEYTHLKAFLIHANQKMKAALWKEVGKSIIKRLESANGNRIWLSTHGAGVPYLHVRICPAPRYYHYRAYAEME